ncbi:3234_t:CDS:2 [Scutellospora calospora]|uniref:3234_t:CDS:1 n=1 Tax=Scutellospora calospora TaxID=85575 RepID=A0ACA9M9V1_9GLOM|nr:3234_t:CDS:2 [Scutellospora calospora]
MNRDTADESDNIIRERSNENKCESIEIEQINKNDDDLFNEQYLQTDQKIGLTTEEAEKRLKEFGQNEITEKKQ